MRSLFAPLEKDRTPRPTLSPRLRQLIVDLKAEYPLLHLHEIARICYVAEGRRPSPHTIQRVLAAGPAPTRLGRRYPPYAENVDPAEARLAIIRLHTEGWRVSTIAAYLECSRQQVYRTLHRWIAEGREGLDDKPRTRTRLALKTTLGAMHAVRELQRNPELGAFRVHAALKREGILLSPRTCGRIIAETMSELVTGQMRETVGPGNGQDPVAHYLSVVAQKTGSLIATAGRFGGMYSGAEPDQIEA